MFRNTFYVMFKDNIDKEEKEFPWMECGSFSKMKEESVGEG